MPELPEVEVIRQGLQPLLFGRTITKITYSGKPLRHPVEVERMRKYLIGNQIIQIDRRAKYLLILFSNHATLIIHLGMTGNMGVVHVDLEKRPHDHLCWSLDNAFELRFNDTRRFGSIQLAEPEETPLIKERYFKQLGVEPLENHCDEHYFIAQARKKSRPIKTFLMDSQIVAGIGNIYANEILFGAGIRPSRAVKSLTKKEWRKIVKQIRTTLLDAISCGGSTISDFVNADGASGYFQINFRVYGKGGTPCPVCNGLIKKETLGGRATFFCPTCQSA